MLKSWLVLKEMKREGQKQNGIEGIVNRIRPPTPSPTIYERKRPKGISAKNQNQIKSYQI